MELSIKLKEISNKVTFRQIGLSILSFKVLILFYFAYLLITQFTSKEFTFDESFYIFLVVGFLAQMIDGALGMAYGIICSTLLLTFGIPAAVASASVHTSEVFTTGISGLSHIKLKNIDKKLFFQLVITGVVGAVAGSYLISGLFDGDTIKPYVSAYLLIMGIYVIYKGIKNKEEQPKVDKKVPALAFAGGFLDAIGGGGWGPIVTSNLLSKGYNPAKTIGTVNTAEFFITFFSTITFIFFLGVTHWQVILGLVAGGAVAAPMGAYFATKANKKLLMILVGCVIILTSAYSIAKFLI